MSAESDDPLSGTDRAARAALPDELLHKAPIGLFQADEKGNCVFVNRRLCELTGLTPALAAGWGWIQSVWPEDRERLLTEWNRATQLGTEFECALRLQRPDGAAVSCLVRAAALRDEHGRPSGILGAVLDMDDRLQAEQALRESEQRYRALVERSPDGIVAMVDNIVRFANPAMARQLGLGDPRELVGRPSLEFVHPDSIALVAERRRMENEGAVLPPVEIRIVRHDGSVLPVEYYSVATEYAGQRARQLVVRDVSERLQAAAALEASQARMRALLKAVPDVIFLLDNAGAYIDHHAPVPEQLILPWERIVGRSVHELLPVGMGAELLRLEAESRRTGDVQLCHLVLPTRRGDREYEVRVTSVSADRWLAIARDVTEARRAAAETATLAQRMQEAQKLESLGVLAGGIAHDFNNILTAILGYADLALIELPADTPLRHHLEQIVTSGRAAAELTRQLLAYSGKTVLSVETVDLPRLLEGMLPLVEVSLGHRSRLRREVEGDVPAVAADSAQLRQVILNLVLNAAEAMDGAADGTIALRLFAADLPLPAAAGTAPGELLAPGRYVVLEIADQGCGMDEATRARMFEPFFSTKFPGRGLGLASVLGIVRGHRGGLEVESEPGAGTRVRVYLPALAGVERGGDPPAAAAAWRGRGPALVVDDEPAVRGLAASLLQHLGFEVLTASDGAQAIDVVRSQPALRVVLLDVTMPQLDGVQTFHTLATLRPELPVVLSSGYHDAESLRPAGVAPAGFARKPYRFEELRAILRRALGE